MISHMFGREAFRANPKTHRSVRNRGRRLNLESLEHRILLASDLFAKATNLGSGTDISEKGSNVGFTAEIGEPSQSGKVNSAWLKWTAPANGMATVDTFGSDFAAA